MASNTEPVREPGTTPHPPTATPNRPTASPEDLDELVTRFARYNRTLGQP